MLQQLFAYRVLGEQSAGVAEKGKYIERVHGIAAIIITEQEGTWL